MNPHLHQSFCMFSRMRAVKIKLSVASTIAEHMRYFLPMICLGSPQWDDKITIFEDAADQEVGQPR